MTANQIPAIQVLCQEYKRQIIKRQKITVPINATQKLREAVKIELKKRAANNIVPSIIFIIYSELVCLSPDQKKLKIERPQKKFVLE